MPHDCTFLADTLDEEQVSLGDDDRDSHAGDWGTPEEDRVRPDAVCWPESTADVSAVLAAANDRDVPVTPYAAGTGIEGNALPARGGVSMDLTRMDRVLDVRPEDFQIDVEPGVLGGTLNDAVAEHGLFLPPLPQSADISTIGGMIATDASGAKTVKYGEVHDWVLELEAVLADGTVIETGSKAKKTSSGYNLKDVLVGSEGTLGVVTRATFELERQPEQIRGGRAVFATLDDAATAIAATMQAGCDVATIELLDQVSTKIADAYSGTDLPDAPTVFLEFHANHGIDAEIEACREIFDEHGVERFEMAAGTEMDELWAARRDLANALLAYDPPRRPAKPGDVTVPISQYPDLVRYAKTLGEEHVLDVPCFGHAGDGNVHYNVLVDPNDPEELEAGREISDAVVERAIEMGGTSTGEHGVGRGKRSYMIAEHGEGTVDAMRAIKRTLDPNATLNPGKIFPAADDERL
ncbi:FAD-binding oxidoreductase [Halococcus saccharolyticus]|uniref:D-lactate dehydrogenase (cytochrome) n=1 Tax=Halococcus saccharolyticus DSM 5350 TaxID=1227455 RepID=M0MJ83_9EURY|nr:FAD-binding oxidoreductase [Halococcus saccharolyticus]EMA45418.1 D-lactate dehydrogenase [Halococcus saccharolyticus DSM 5350]